MTKNSNTMVLVNFFEKIQIFHIHIQAITFEDDVMQFHEQNQKLKKNENPRFYGQNKLLFWHPALQPLGSYSHVAAY